MDIYNGLYNNAIINAIIATLITFLLNILCISNLSIISWMIVFIPFIFMSVILLMVSYIYTYDAVNTDTTLVPSSETILPNNIVIQENQEDYTPQEIIDVNQGQDIVYIREVTN
jgi:hypothetical protein|tara:strand:+ start:292 stop:633 length:342 start_codon:yes stop_codon:yes gene_type:complete